jgi:hypothetical protein
MRPLATGTGRAAALGCLVSSAGGRRPGSGTAPTAHPCARADGAATGVRVRVRVRGTADVGGGGTMREQLAKATRLDEAIAANLALIGYPLLEEERDDRSN